MMDAIVGENQNLVDFAITNYGSKWEEGIVSMLKANNSLNLEVGVNVGDELITPEVDSNDFVLKTYIENRHRVSTRSTTLYQQVPEGDFMLTPEGLKIEFI